MTSTYWNNDIYEDQYSTPFHTTFTNQAQYYINAPFTNDTGGSINYKPVLISQANFQIDQGTHFLADANSKFISLPPINPDIGNRFIMITDISGTISHTLASVDSSKIQNVSAYTLLPYQTLHLLFNGTNWNIIAAFPLPAATANVRV